jgi:hypothetical protein
MVRDCLVGARSAKFGITVLVSLIGDAVDVILKGNEKMRRLHVPRGDWGRFTAVFLV